MIRISFVILSTSFSHSARSLSTSSSSSLLPKHSHVDFFQNRNWDAVAGFWRMAVKSGTLPSSLTPNSPFNTSLDCNLRAVQAIGAAGEFVSKDTRYQKRKTYAIRVGYDGSQYSVGYINTVPLATLTVFIIHCMGIGISNAEGNK